jgi:hypothetical protein
MTLMIRRVSDDGDLISISNPPVRVSEVCGAADTPHKNGAKRKLTEIRLAGLLEHRGASQQTKRRKIPAKEEAFHRRNT